MSVKVHLIIVLFLICLLNVVSEASDSPFLDWIAEHRKIGKNEEKNVPETKVDQQQCKAMNYPCTGLPKCCGTLKCYWKDGFDHREPGKCVDCIQENHVCQREEQCCGDLYCHKTTAFSLDGLCVSKRSVMSECHRDAQCLTDFCFVTSTERAQGHGGRCMIRPSDHRDDTNNGRDLDENRGSRKLSPEAQEAIVKGWKSLLEDEEERVREKIGRMSMDGIVGYSPEGRDLTAEEEKILLDMEFKRGGQEDLLLLQERDSELSRGLPTARRFKRRCNNWGTFPGDFKRNENVNRKKNIDGIELARKDCDDDDDGTFAGDFRGLAEYEKSIGESEKVARNVDKKEFGGERNRNGRLSGLGKLEAYPYARSDKKNSEKTAAVEKKEFGGYGGNYASLRLSPFAPAYFVRNDELMSPSGPPGERNRNGRLPGFGKLKAYPYARSDDNDGNFPGGKDLFLLQERDSELPLGPSSAGSFKRRCNNWGNFPGNFRRIENVNGKKNVDGIELARKDCGDDDDGTFAGDFRGLAEYEKSNGESETALRSGDKKEFGGKRNRNGRLPGLGKLEAYPYARSDEKNSEKMAAVEKMADEQDDDILRNSNSVEKRRFWEFYNKFFGRKKPSTTVKPRIDPKGKSARELEKIDGDYLEGTDMRDLSGEKGEFLTKKVVKNSNRNDGRRSENTEEKYVDVNKQKLSLSNEQRTENANAIKSTNDIDNMNLMQLLEKGLELERIESGSDEMGDKMGLSQLIEKAFNAKN